MPTSKKCGALPGSPWEVKSNSSRVSLSARAAPSAMVSRLFPQACFMESERSSKNTTQPGSLRLISLEYMKLPPFGDHGAGGRDCVRRLGATRTSGHGEPGCQVQTFSQDSQ